MARKSTEMKRLEAREAELLERLKSDQAELEDVRVAKRVLHRLAGEQEHNSPEAATVSEQLMSYDDAVRGLETMRPEHSEDRTIGELAYGLLLQAGSRGLTSNEILDLLRADSMPELVRTSLSPPLSRLKKRGKIDLVGDHWKVVPGNGGAT